MKKFLAILLSSTMIVSSAIAGQFYNRNSGQWTVAGYTAEGSLNPTCMASTRWPNGAAMRLIHDLKDGELYILYENPYLNIMDKPGSVFNLRVVFDNSVALMGEYEVISVNAFRIRNISHEVFLPKFSAASVMDFIMPGNMPNIRAGLTGTRNSMLLMAECINLSRNYTSGPHAPASKPGITL